MAFRTWGKIAPATLGAGVIAGSSQVGLAHGLGILSFDRVFAATARDQWTAQLTWVCWFTLVATALSTLAGGRFAAHWKSTSRRTRDERFGQTPGAGARVALTLLAGLGAAVVVPLTAQSARFAQVAGVNAVLVIGICAGLGTVAGAFVGYAALARPTAQWSLSTVSAAVWVIAVASAVPSLRPGESLPGEPLPTVRLGVFDAGFLPPPVTQWFALVTMPAMALVAGAILGWLARRRGLSTGATLLAGVPGPVLLTAAYLLAGPGSGDALAGLAVAVHGEVPIDRYQMNPYWAAVAATGAGLVGSMLAALLRPSAVQQSAVVTRRAADDAATAIGTGEPGHGTGEPARGAGPAGTGLPAQTNRQPRPGPAGATAGGWAMATPTMESGRRPGPTAAGVSPPADNRAAQRPARRNPRVGAKDVEYVDWVSGLGGAGNR